MSTLGINFSYVSCHCKALYIHVHMCTGESRVSLFRSDLMLAFTTLLSYRLANVYTRTMSVCATIEIYKYTNFC
jgi:hypothetical protein